MRAAIDQLKYRGDARRARVFAALVVAFLDAHPDEFGRFDLIIARPHTGHRAYDSSTHTQLVVEQAAQMGGRWP